MQVNPQDLERRGLTPGDLVRVTSRRGSILLPVTASSETPPLQAWIPMHWGREFLSGRASDGGPSGGINELTNPASCPQSRQPELKHCAVRIEKATLAWTMLACAWLPQEEALLALASLRALMGRFASAICVPSGREPLNAQAQDAASSRLGILFRAADEMAPAGELLAGIERLLGLDGQTVLRYVDPGRSQHRAMRLGGPSQQLTLQAFLLAGDTRAQGWVRTLLQEELPAQAYGRLLLRPGAVAPVAVVDRGSQVCGCFDVTRSGIVAALRRIDGNPGQRLLELQRQLRCGTNCGSCLPELRRLLCEQAPDAATQLGG